jgi:Protein of unknown function (DUF664)
VKEILHDKLRESRAALLSRLDGLGEYDLRRPMTPSGTNLLGLVKHVAGLEYGYLGESLGRPGRRLSGGSKTARSGTAPICELWPTSPASTSSGCTVAPASMPTG